MRLQAFSLHGLLSSGIFWLWCFNLRQERQHGVGSEQLTRTTLFHWYHDTYFLCITQSTQRDVNLSYIILMVLQHPFHQKQLKNTLNSQSIILSRTSSCKSSLKKQKELLQNKKLALLILTASPSLASRLHSAANLIFSFHFNIMLQSWTLQGKCCFCLRDQHSRFLAIGHYHME